MVVTTAAEYAKVYADAFANNALTQGAWHTERDGRQLACALGVIGEEIEDPRDCPASIMPRWLAQMVPAFFDRQKAEYAFEWGKSFTAELARIDGKVPFSVIHDWHANTVCQMVIDAAEKCGRDPVLHKALRVLHLRAFAGEKIGADEWKPVLRNTYPYPCADAGTDAHAYAYADADAHAYADAYACADACADAWKCLADGMTAALSRVKIDE